MPSISATINSACFESRLAIHGEVIEVLSGADSGKKFFGIISVASPLDLPTDLNADQRERSMIEFPHSNFPNLKSHDHVLDENGQTWSVSSRKLDKGDDCVEYEAVKRIGGVDT